MSNRNAPYPRHFLAPGDADYLRDRGRRPTPDNPLGLTEEDRRYLAAEGDPDVVGVDPAYYPTTASLKEDRKRARQALEEAVTAQANRERQELEQQQYEVLRARLLSDPVVIDSLVAATLARLRMNRQKAAAREEASHRAVLADVMGTGGQG